MLTQRQADLLYFINERVQSGGLAPTFSEMMDGVGLKSKSGIHRILTALNERGFIRRLSNRARAIEIVKLPGPDYSTLVGNLKLVTDCLSSSAKRLNTTDYDIIIAHAKVVLDGAKRPRSSSH